MSLHDSHKRNILIISVLAIFTLAVFILNRPVTTNYGINYKFSSRQIPLYLKILDFFDRHYNYHQLLKRIIEESSPDSSSNHQISDEKLVMIIFEWTYNNIRTIPQGFPIIDDHTWYTIVRGYGAIDQISDVFATICNYAGFDAFYNHLWDKSRNRSIDLAFVRINQRWQIFDPFRGVYFTNNSKGDLLGRNWQKHKLKKERADHDRQTIKSKQEELREEEIDYSLFLSQIDQIQFPPLENHSLNQSPLNRLMYEMNKLIKGR